MKTATWARASAGVRILGGSLLTVWLAAAAHAATLTWDTAPGTVGAGNGTITGGAGTWDTANGSWTADGGATNVAWNSGTPDAATFAGATGGLVTLGTSLTANSLTFNTAGYTIGAAADTVNTLTLSGAKTLTLNANAQINSLVFGGQSIDANGNTLTIGGPIYVSGAGGTTTFIDGVFELNRWGANGATPAGWTYFGALGYGWTIGNGTDATTVRFMTNAQQGHQAQITIKRNATLDLNGYDTYGPVWLTTAVGLMTFNGGGSLINGTLPYTTGGFSYVNQTGGVRATITSTIATTGYAINVADDANLPVELEVSGTINSGNVIKQGLGTLLLSGNNTTTGTTTISAGKLLVTGTQSGGGAYTVANTAALGGTGTIGIGSNTVTVQSGGAVAPGMSIGTLNVTGGVTFASGSFFDAEFGGSGTITADKLAVSGAIDLGGATLRLYDLGTTMVTPQTLTLLTAGSPITGTFAGLSEGSWLTYKGFVGQLSYAGNQVQLLNFIPEPAALTLLALGSALCLRRGRR